MFVISDQQWRTQEFCSGGVQQIQLRTVRGSGGSCNLVKEISLRCVIPVVCVTNEREESVVNQLFLFLIL